MTAPYPWQAKPWANLSQAASTGRLPHALLLSGRAGLGKSQFALEFVRFLLCEAKLDATPCGRCRGCILYVAKNHPDYLHIAPEEEGKAIVIDQIRGLNEFFTLKSHYQGAKVAVIDPAEAMNRAGANALLKILEEPPAGGCVILVANRFEALLPTIRSRCQRIMMDKFDSAIAQDWLRQQAPAEAAEQLNTMLTRGSRAPLSALRDLASKLHETEQLVIRLMTQVAEKELHGLEAAGKFAAGDVHKLVDLMVWAVYELLAAQHGMAAPGVPAGATQGIAALHSLQNQLNSKALHRFLDLAFEVKGLIAGNSNLRDADLLEMLWLGWMQTTGSQAPVQVFN